MTHFPAVGGGGVEQDGLCQLLGKAVTVDDGDHFRVQKSGARIEVGGADDSEAPVHYQRFRVQSHVARADGLGIHPRLFDRRIVPRLKQRSARCQNGFSPRFIVAVHRSDIL